MDVLILEDDVRLGVELAACARSRSHSAVATRTVDAALAHCEAQWFDVVIADFIIRSASASIEQGATTLFQRLRTMAVDRRLPRPLMLLISGASLAVDGNLAWQSTGADELIRKPVRPDRVIDLAERLLARRPRS